MHYRLRMLRALVLFALAVPAVHAQEASPPRVEHLGSELRTLTSSLVEGQTYDIYVNLPRSYWEAAARSTYPVLYVLDGQWDFGMVSAIYGGQFYDGFVPEIIIVGITWEDGNTNGLRSRDFTPTRIDGMPRAGGASAFLSFIKEELIPFIEAEYPVRADERALMGSSYGGLFTLYALFHETALFNRYVVSSPSLHWDDGITYRYEEDYAAGHTELPARVFMVLGEHENVEPVERLAETLRERNYEGLDLQTHVVAGTGHSGHKPEGYTKGMQFIYQRPSLALLADVLDTYVGTYRITDQVQIDIWREDDHLMGRQNGGEEVRFHAETEDRFYIPGSYLFIQFKRQDGEVVGFDVEMFNEVAYAERVKG
jgi:hypothetical protein